jgi:quercetin dioxygenase-like cupin family protein
MRKTRVLIGTGALLTCLAPLTLLARSEAREPAQTLIPQFENRQVTVWKTVLQPGERIGMHRHDHGRVVVALKGGTLGIPQQDGTSRKLVLETGKAYWLDADPPGQLHGDANLSGKPIEMMVVEMK